MKREIKWTIGSGQHIVITVATRFELDSQGREKPHGRQEVVYSATIDGAEHTCIGRVITTDHPVAVAKLGDIGLSQDNYDRLIDARSAALASITAHNAACDSHEGELDAVSEESQKVENTMRCGE